MCFGTAPSKKRPFQISDAINKLPYGQRRRALNFLPGSRAFIPPISVDDIKRRVLY